jgi:CRISPR-associated protein Cmr2
MAIDTTQKELHAVFKGLKGEQVTEILSQRDFDLFTRIDLLAAALPTGLKETAREHYRLLVQSGKEIQEAYAARLESMNRLGLNEDPIKALDCLPVYSAAVQMRFKMATPFISTDDDAFYIHDNPVRKEKVFRIPCIPASGWKGCLRSADGDLFLEEVTREISKTVVAPDDIDKLDLKSVWDLRMRRVRIFGNENAAWEKHLSKSIIAVISKKLNKNISDVPRFQGEILNDGFIQHLINCGYRTDRVEGWAGRLNCFPTYFNRLGIEVLNPHDRKRRVGTHPIYFESVPQGAIGSFGFLYLFEANDLHPDISPAKIAKNGDVNLQLAGDMEMLGHAVYAMLRVKGFGAKTSSGFGTAENDLAAQGVLQLKMPDPEADNKDDGTCINKTCIWQVPFNTIGDLRKSFCAVAESLRGETV